MVTWSNWAGTAECTPASIEQPVSEDEIITAIKDAAAEGRRVKVRGTGHSFTDIACTDGVMLSLERHRRVVSLDPETGWAVVEAGITLTDLNDALAGAGLAMENLGDIAYQSLAGAISTGTHGTGARFGNLATQVVGLRLALADGTVLEATILDDEEVFDACRVGLGALGVIMQVTLQCVPAFTLEALRGPGDLERTLVQLEQLVEENEHFEFYWFPHTHRVDLKRNNRVRLPPKPRGSVRAWLEDVLFENLAFGLVCRIGRARPAAVPFLARTTGRMLSNSRRTERSDQVFTSPRLVRFAEMEYAIPRGKAAEAVRAIVGLIPAGDLRVSFPIEVRFSAGDDIYLSPAFGRESCYIAVHMFEGVEFESYFRAVEEAMDDFEGRPHWGKIHFQSAETLAPRYPEWDRFRRVRDRLDPERRFGNAYLDRVLG